MSIVSRRPSEILRKVLEPFAIWGACQTNTYSTIRRRLNGIVFQITDARGVRSSKRHSALPIGRTARIAYEIDAMRQACCKAAQTLMNKPTVDEAELDECARLDDALAEAHRLLKGTVRAVMISRITRRSRAS